MVRIAGVDVPDRKRAHVALRAIYGIGPKHSMEILAKVQIDSVLPPRINELDEGQVDRIREIVDREYTTEGELRREVNQNIAVSSRSALIGGCGTGEAYQPTASVPGPMHAPGKAHAAPLPVAAAVPGVRSR